MTMYRLNRYGVITKHEIVKVTPKSIFFINSLGNERREFKVCGDQSWWDLFPQAKNMLISKRKKELESAKIRLEQCEIALNKAENLKEEDITE